ncbi:Rieske 2Fe-2S domain-containing protein [Synechococcales cyanobacterium C]|uniref:Rieske 2Fe-2S domain-containing protein n=1 Tax=Petrachloros mirabilis ULC683 TaxID=2781853 RepID=A0A8K1ZVP0_9CYAN|nr:Rieske 2Fe-2S domain-containing protein [Petrachloros mirabilis ULC683]
MELATTLQGQPIQNRIRQAGINPNYWYPVAWAHQLAPGKVLAASVWQQKIAAYRDLEGHLHALEDACPHKGVALHLGEVQGGNLTCPYHGWQFDGEGNCVHIPYFPPDQKLPCAIARSYPIQEQYDILWVFPGAPELAAQVSLPSVPEYGNPAWFMVRIPNQFQAHFSICNENAMDVFHGFLHKGLQGWFDPVLKKLRQTPQDIEADYQVSYRQNFLAKVLGLTSPGNSVATRTVSIHYQYPHFHSSLEGVSSLYLMRLPVESNVTRSFSLMFLKLPLPAWMYQPPVGHWLEAAVLRLIFQRFVAQDAEMVASEQCSYENNPERHYVEVNPAILALQRVIIGQYEQFVQQSKGHLSQINGDQTSSLLTAEAISFP